MTRWMDNIEILINAMRPGSNQSATMLLAQLRLGYEVEALASTICTNSSIVVDDGIRHD